MSEVLFTDFSSDDSGDLATNAQGDIDMVTGTDNLTKALQRRFETPIGAFFYDPTYGNRAFDLLSKPMGQTFESELIGEISDCMLSDNRVQSVNVTVTVNRETRTVQVQIDYVATDGYSDSFERRLALRV